MGEKLPSSKAFLNFSTCCRCSAFFFCFTARLACLISSMKILFFMSAVILESPLIRNRNTPPGDRRLEPFCKPKTPIRGSLKAFPFPNIKYAAHYFISQYLISNVKQHFFGVQNFWIWFFFIDNESVPSLTVPISSEILVAVANVLLDLIYTVKQEIWDKNW